MADLRWAARLLFGALVCLLTAGPALTSPPGQDPLGQSRCVILVVADRLMPADLLRWAPPGLQRLLQRAQLATVSSRGASFDGDVGGFATIGAGAGVGIPDRGTQPLPSTAAGFPEYAQELADASRRTHNASQPGALGGAIRDEDGFTALVGNSAGREGVLPDALAARLIAMDRGGQVTEDFSNRGEVEARSWPYEQRSVPWQLVRGVESILNRHPGTPGLVVVDPGDSSRADSWVWVDSRSPRAAARARDFWMPRVLEKLDALLEPLYGMAQRRGCLLCLVSPVPRRGADGGPIPGLTPLALWPPGAPAGPLTSASTRRPGLVLAMDLAPDLLQFVQTPVPVTMTGQPLALAADAGTQMAPDKVRQIFALDGRSRADYAFERWALILCNVAAGLSLFFGAVIPDQRMSGGLARLLQFFLVAGLAGAAAQILPMGTPAPSWWGPALVTAFLWFLFPLLAYRVRRPAPRLAVVCSIPAAVLALDSLSQSHLFRDALWGRMPIAGGRLYGMDNTCLGVFMGASWISLGVLAERKPWGPRAAAVGAVAAAFLVGLPAFGANVGGGFTAAVGAGFLVARLRNGRGGWRGMLTGLLLAALVAGLSIALDEARVLAPGSHLAHSLNQVVAMPSAAADIALRKVWQNLSLTLWLLPGSIPIALVVRRIRQEKELFRRRFDGHPGMAAGLASLLPAMVAGYVVNDTGVITVVFMALYYLSAFIYLRLERLSRGAALPPSKPAAPAVSGPAPAPSASAPPSWPGPATEGKT